MKKSFLVKQIDHLPRSHKKVVIATQWCLVIILLTFLHHFLCGKRKRLSSLNSVQLTAITVVFCLVPSLGKWDLLQPASALVQCIRSGFWVPSNFVRIKVIIEKSRFGIFLWNRNWDLGWIWARLATFEAVFFMFSWAKIKD